MSEDKIIEIKNFKKVNGEIVNVKKRRTKTNKKKRPVKDLEEDVMADDSDFEDDMLDLMEENEALQMELFKERIRRQTIEKLLNKLLKQQQKKNEDE